MKLSQNFGNYVNVRKALREFVSTIVWECIEDECVAINPDTNENEVDEQVDLFVATAHKACVEEIRRRFEEFVNMQKPRYQVTLNKLDENNNLIEAEVNYTEKCVNAISMALKFRDKHPNTKVIVYDKKEKEEILYL